MDSHAEIIAPPDEMSNRRQAFLPAKIIRPHLPEVLTRTRLLELLADGMKSSVVWIGGPAGCGKTTLVADFTRRHGQRTLWYKVDADDADSATFFYYFGLFGRRKAADPANPLPYFTPEYAAGVSAFAKRFFSELFARQRTPTILVLDDFQEALHAPGLLKIVLEAVAVMPAGFNLIIISRTGPPAEMARLIVNRMMTVIDWTHLRLTKSETGELLSILNNKTFSANRIERMHKDTDGWVAGLILTARENSEISTATFASVQNQPDLFFDYFAKEIFERLSLQDRDFLLITSILPRMSVPLVSAFTGRRQAAKILNRFYHHNFFITRHGRREDAVYRYHTLFRNFLNALLKEKYGPERLAELQGRAAELMAAEGRTEEAVVLYQTCERFEEMIPLIQVKAPELLAQGRHLTLAQWINAIPDALIQAHPLLSYWLGSARMPFDPVAGRIFFKNAWEGFQGQKNRNGALMALSGVLLSIAFSFDSYAVFDNWIPKIEALENELPGLPLQEKALVCAGVLFALVLRRPDHPELAVWDRLAVEILREHLPVELKTQLFTPLLFQRLFTGLLSEAQIMLKEFARISDGEKSIPHVTVIMKHYQTVYFSFHADFEACKRSCVEMLALAESSGVHSLDFFAMEQGITGALSCQDLEFAQNYLQKLEGALNEAGAWPQEYYYFLLLWKALMENSPHSARHYSDQQLSHALNSGIPLTQSYGRWGRSLALQRCGEFENASRELDDALELSRLCGFNQVRFGCLLTKAEFAFEHKKDGAAFSFLQKALKFGKQHAFKTVLLWRSEVMADLCGRALKEGIETQYVQGLIRTHRLVPHDVHLTLPDWPWPVKIQTLGGFKLLQDDAPIIFRGKTPHKPLTLLKLLIAMGGCEVPVYRLLDALWPEMEGDAAHNAFNTCMHRLRKLLTVEQAVIVAEEKVTLNRRCCWVDLWHYERMLTETDHAWERAGDGSQMAAAATMTETILQRQEGPFLPGEPDLWAVPPRERLQTRFNRCLRRLGEYYEKNHQTEKAAGCYLAGIDAVPLAENLYRRLMRCYHKLGQTSDVRATYRRCKIKLAAEGLEPADKTTTLFHSLVRKKDHVLPPLSN